MGCPRTESEIPGSALWIEAKGHRHRFQQSRLSGAVFADDKSHLGMQWQHIQMTNCRQAKRVAIKARDVFCPEAYLRDILVGNHGLRCAVSDGVAFLDWKMLFRLQ